MEKVVKIAEKRVRSKKRRQIKEARKQYLQEELDKMSDEIKEMERKYGIPEGNNVKINVVQRQTWTICIPRGQLGNKFSKPDLIA